MRPLPVVLCLVLFTLPVVRSAFAAVPLTAGRRITGPVRLAPGEYRLADPGAGRLQVSGSGYVLDLKGVRLRGDGKGTGIHVTDADGLTIRNADVSGCGWGIVLERCRGVRLEHCTASRNADLPPGTVIDESGREPEDQHGGGILLRDSRDCRVLDCVAQYQWDGIDVVRSDGNRIENGDYSYNGNWGVHFWKSSRNVFRRNRAVWCTTGAGTLFQALTGWQTYDAQAVAIDHASCDNLIEENDLRFGGDGVFIRANEGGEQPGSPVPPRNSSDRNILRNNDCSFSPNNAIEVDFVADTVIEGNNCSYSNYGMWLGYSRGSRVRNNTCVNDSSRAVEIENGQNGLFEGNVLGWDPPRPGGELVYLRQNGRDGTPSGPYTLTGNVFYGAGKAVRLLRTPGVRAAHNVVPAGGLAVTDEVSSLTSEGNDSAGPGTAPVISGTKELALRSSTLVTLKGRHLRAGSGLPVVTLNGIPAWVRSATDREIRFWMPADFWDRPAPEMAELRIYNGMGSATVPARLEWPEELPLIRSISPNPAAPGDTVTVTGENLVGSGGSPGSRVLLNNQPAAVRSASPARLVFQAPLGMVIPVRYNLLVEREGQADRSWPIPFSVQIPNERLPHLLSARFSPLELRVGETLTVEFVLRNNLPYAAPLQTRPAPPFTYEETQAWQEMGIRETRGALHLRVTSDHPGDHHPGSWPWLFGFAAPTLAPGETVTVRGAIKVRTTGEHEFRVGLVAGGDRFIDDNAFRTKITVRP